MKAISCPRLGGLDVLELVDIPPPVPGEGQVRVAMRAIGLNFPDILMVKGGYQYQPPLPFIPGLEGAGEIAEFGPGVAEKFPHLKIGDRVITAHRDGAFAEQTLTRADLLFPMPDNMSWAEGAAFRVAYATAYVSLVERGQLRAGETLLVHGAAGGVGLAAVDLGKLLGATVIATAGSEEKLAFLRDYGADHVINYREGEFRTKVKDLTGGEGADVIYDPVGGDVFDQSVRCIAWDGRILVIGFAGGRIADIGTNMPLIKGFSVVGVRAGETVRRDPGAASRTRECLLGWANEGKLRPHVHTVMPLEDAAAALEIISHRDVIGKVILEVGGSE